MPPYKKAGIRAPWHDYTGTGFTMITLVTAPRRALFGLCKDNAVQLSPEGYCVREAWKAIPSFTPQIEAQELCVMPDHLHGILFAKEKLPRSLSAIIRGFKSGITSALRRTSQDPNLSVFQEGFHDLVSLDVKSIKAYSAYIRDNPRRFCLKRAHPDLFTRLDHLSSPRLPKDLPWKGFGNPFLLDKPLRRAVRVSRSATVEEIEAQKVLLRETLHQGGVLISPFISPGEKEMVACAIEEGGSVIVLKHEGFPPLYKPSGAYFDLCAQGRLLILSCHAFTGQKQPLSREACLQMNAWCTALAEYHGNNALGQ
jgi:REP element-mobilizing transposase RayT